MKVHRLELLRGVHPRVLELPRQWIKRGPFEIFVAMNGGLRISEKVQAGLSGTGMSAAATLRKTPHGRGGAADLCPLGFLAFTPVSYGGTAKRWASWDELPQLIRDQFTEIGKFSESLGLKWGGRWVGKSYPNGDQPHHELADWGRLPFPAPTYEFPADLEALSVAG